MTAKKKFDALHEAHVMCVALKPLPQTLDGVRMVPKLFAALPFKDPVERYDVFQLLDEQPGRFGADYFGWHSVLRRARNDPSLGLFNAINSTKEFA